MKPIVISVITQKGGVGKTTSTIHLGGGLAQEGYKVLLIDFDTQINLSIGYGVENYESNIETFLAGEKAPSLTRRGKNENVYILAGSKEIKERKLNRNSLKKAISNLQEEFDFILIDCPPKPINEELSFGEIAVCASNYVVSPILADNYSLAGIGTLISSVNNLKQSEGLPVEMLGFFFNMAEERTNDFKEYYNTLKESKASHYLLKNFIRKDVNIKNAMKKGTTIFDIKPYGRASQDMRKLTKEILNKIQKDEN